MRTHGVYVACCWRRQSLTPRSMEATAESARVGNKVGGAPQGPVERTPPPFGTLGGPPRALNLGFGDPGDPLGPLGPLEGGSGPPWCP